MSTQNNSNNSVKPSDPIPINAGFRSARPRSISVSSGSSSSVSEIQTPPSPSAQRVNIPSSPPGNSPILSYFFAQSPKTPASTFPFKRKFGTAPLFEDEETDNEVPATTHARRASTIVSGRFSQVPTNIPDTHLERGTNLLRRLSLSSSAFTAKPSNETRSPTAPSPPPNTAVSSPPKAIPFSRDRKPRRASTINVESGRSRRAPSPMGERILTGHFDGFN